MKSNDTFRFSKNHFVALVVILASSLFALTGCEEDEDNKLAQAQKCMDNLKDTDSDATAQRCMDYVDGVSSAESYVIRCSAYFFIGGVSASELTSAFTAADNASNSAEKDAILINALKQDSVSESDTTFAACNASGVPSLMAIAAFSKLGTYVINLGSNADIGTALTNCYAGGSGGVCNDAEIGSMISVIAPLYCTGDTADSSVCSDIATAIANAGGDAAQIAINLYQLLDY
jgi:hypothetical protein